MSAITTISLAIQHLSDHITTVPQQFNALPGEVVSQRPAPGKWSKKEIMGHLVDSAINNLKRFTDSQCMPQPYTVIRYQQDDMVRVNNYQQLPAEHILQLWAALNTQILEVIKIIPADKLAYTVLTYDSGAKTLEWLITDYVAHMEHHLNQVFG